MWQFRKCWHWDFIWQLKSTTLWLLWGSADNNVESICGRKNSLPLILFLLLTGSSSLKRFKNRRTWGRYNLHDMLAYWKIVLCVFYAFATLCLDTVKNNLGSFSHTLLITVLFQSLRDKQKSVRENQAPNMKQMKMWSVSSFFQNPTAVEFNEIQQILPLDFRLWDLNLKKRMFWNVITSAVPCGDLHVISALCSSAN